MASVGTGTRAAATALLLFSFSTAVLLLLLLKAPGLADFLASALDRFLDGRGGGLLELATRRNMILLCHAILLVILRDAGVLGTPTTRRSPPVEADTAAVFAVSVAQTAAAPARPRATSGAVVWRRRRPRNRAIAPVHDAARHVIEHQTPRGPVAEPVATWAAPLLTTGPPAQTAEEAAAVVTKQTVLAEPPRDDDDDLLDRHDHHGRYAVVEPAEHPTAIAADGERDDCDDRRIITVSVADDDEKRMDDTAREHQTAGTGMEMEMEMELADDRTFEEFIKSQRRQMRQESLQLVSSYQYQAITTTCY